MRKTIIALVALVLILAVGAFGALYWASKNAAVIANEVALEQKVLKGKITVHQMQVGMLGDISFENLVWTDPEGKLVADIPKGLVKINLKDAVTGNFNSQSLEKIEFDDAVLNLVFNDKMELNVINLSKDKREENNKSATKTPGKFNFALLLKNSSISTTYANRHYALEGANADIRLDTDNELKLNIKTNKISGNINAQNIDFNGNIDLKPQVPVYNLNLTIGSVIPSSISAGIDVNEPLNIKAHITGELPQPVINGEFSMAALSMSPLYLENFRGVFNYSNALLKITESSANTFGGAVNAGGTIQIDSKNFNFNITGQGLNATQVTDGKVSGPLNFDMTTSGSADSKSLGAEGTFYIGEGKFSNIPFKSMKGNFARYNGKMSFSNIVIGTIAGEFTTDILQNAAGKIQLGGLTPFFIQNAIKDELTERGRDLIKGLFKR